MRRSCRNDVTEVATVAGFKEWDGDIAAARALQVELAQQVNLRDGYAKPLRTIAGFDVGFEDDGSTARAAAVLLDAETLRVIDARIARIPARMPYIPGLQSFRELPALLLALEMLPHAPDLVFVDGHGIAHPKRLGIASHFGVASGLSSIGVARKILVGTGQAPHPVRGAYTPLRHRGAQVGWLLCSKLECNPLVISPGHRVSMASAADLVMRFVGKYRLPEPTRLADRLASRRDEDRCS
jgi:deoxyribonuclease V